MSPPALPSPSLLTPPPPLTPRLSPPALPAPTRVLTVCEKLRQRLELVPEFDGAYVPRCTNTGDFQPMQCATHNAACWCVDRNGDEIHGTRRRSPNRPDCSLRGEGVAPYPPHPLTTSPLTHHTSLHRPQLQPER